MTSHLSSYNMQIFTVYQKDDQIFDTEKINCTLKRWKISRARKSVTHVLCSCCIYICCFLYMHVCTLPICIHMHHILDRSNKLKEKNQLELITVLCTYIWLGSMQRRRRHSCLAWGLEPMLDRLPWPSLYLATSRLRLIITSTIPQFAVTWQCSYPWINLENNQIQCKSVSVARIIFCISE